MSTLILHKCYGNGRNRDIESLAELYNNPQDLREIILDVFPPDFLDSLKNKKVLLKPNWVKHNTRACDDICLHTHPSFILSTLEIILEKSPASILIADAPIQSCEFGRIITKDFSEKLKSLSEKFDIKIDVRDLRRRTFINGAISDEKSPLSDYLIFNLEKESLLEPISSKKEIFRVTNYDPKRLAMSHSEGVHKYCIAKEVFEADVVISMPKVKTHQKTGITCALKNLVGINGDKDFLPHHRVGGTSCGGDCYPGCNILRHASERLLDFANSRQRKFYYKTLLRVSALLWRISIPSKEHSIVAAWHGNDTCWRMVMDLNKIAKFGKADGSISTIPQRTLYSLSDGIIGGQGDGPLCPHPLALGFVMFSDDSALNDVAVSQLFGFDAEKISLIQHGFSSLDFNKVRITLNSKALDNVFELRNESIETMPPPGWEKHLLSK